VEAIYEEFVKLKKECGEATEGISFDKSRTRCAEPRPSSYIVTPDNR